MDGPARRPQDPMLLDRGIEDIQGGDHDVATDVSPPAAAEPPEPGGMTGEGAPAPDARRQGGMGGEG